MSALTREGLAEVMRRTWFGTDAGSIEPWMRVVDATLTAIEADCARWGVNIRARYRTDPSLDFQWAEAADKIADHLRRIREGKQ